MIKIPRFDSPFNRSDINARTYINGRIVYDDTTKISEMEKKYAPYVKQLTGLVKDIDAEIRQSTRRAKEMMEQFPKKTEIEIEATKNKTTLFNTKMSALKMIINSIKEVKDMEMKEKKLIHDLTGKNVDIVGGNISNKVFAGNMLDRNNSGVRENGLAYIPSYADTPSQPKVEATKLNVTEDELETKEVIQSTEQIPIQPKLMATTNSSLQARINSPATTVGTTNLFGDIVNPDKSPYIVGTKSENYEGIDGRFSYGSAETGLKNKYHRETSVKCHWDEEHGIGWLRTYDTATNTFSENEALIPPQQHGKIVINRSGNDVYALDELNDTYSVVYDKFENAPDIIKEELRKMIGE